MSDHREIHPELQAVFDEHAAPQHTSKRAVHAQLAPVLKVAADIWRQVAEYRARLAQAKVAEHDPDLDFKMEHMFQTLGAAERNAAAFQHVALLLANDFAQLDRYMGEWKADVAQWQAVGSTISPPVVAVSSGSSNPAGTYTSATTGTEQGP